MTSTLIQTVPENAQRRRGGKARAIAALIAGLLVVFAVILPRIARFHESVAVAKEAETTLPAVSVTSARTSGSAAEVVLPGSTEALNVAAIGARATGYVRERLVDIGSTVKAGQVLAVIESPELDQEVEQAKATVEQTKAVREQARSNLDQARASVNQARANLAQFEANEQIAATTDQRWTKLVEKGVLPKQSGDERRSALQASHAATEAGRAALGTAQANIASRTADLAAADANVAAQNANLRRVQRLQAFERVEAPFNGVVTQREVEKGDLVTAGTGALFAVVEASTLRILVNVPQSYAVDLNVGQKAEVLIPEKPGKKYAGTVARTARALQSSSRTLLTEVQVDNKNGDLLAGMYAQVKFDIPRSEPIALVPADALIADAKGTRVAVVDSGNRVHFRGVQVGRDLGPEVEVLSGIHGGENVISNAPDTLEEGAEIPRIGGGAK
jgi:multidrug efflux pump subunit AcrA (membrane-fusion protein)